MKILSEIELQKLPTKRLLALYKKVRDLVKQSEEYDDRIELFVYKDEIKKILDTREDVHEGKI